MEVSRMPNWLARQAHLAPEKLALIADGVRWTFADLEALALQGAALLADWGVERGMRVAVLAQNNPRLVVLIHALMKRGAVLVPLNIRLTAHELAWQVRDVQPHLFLYDQAHEVKAAEVLEEVAVPARALEELPLATPPAGEPANRREGTPPQGAGQSGGGEDVDESPATSPIALPYLDRNDVHCIIYTSGTTGHPKGAMLTYGNHWWSAIGSALNLGNLPDDRWLACVPLFHVSGLSILMRSVILGIPVVLMPGFDPAAVNRLIEQERVTIISVVANMLQRMLDAQGDRPYPEHLRCVLLGGGPAPRPLLEACAERGIPVVQTYGMTETASQVVTLPPHEALRKLGSAGKPLFPVELRIAPLADETGAADGKERVPSGAATAVGEIVIRGPNVTAGYFNRPEETARAIRDGWLHTGDLGYLDDEGFLYVLDRRKDLIISGGENVYPAEVEAVLLSHPSVAEAGVIGRADPRWGQVPVAFIRVKDGETWDEEALKQHCRKQLAAYKVPVRIYAVPALPYNASGKLMRRELRRWLPKDESEIEI